MPITLPAMRFEQANYWTSQFGSLCILRKATAPAAITAAPPDSLGDLPIAQEIWLRQGNMLADRLARNRLVESIVTAREFDTAALLRQEMDFVLVTAVDRLGLDLAGATRPDLRQIEPGRARSCPGNATVLRRAETGG